MRTRHFTLPAFFAGALFGAGAAWLALPYAALSQAPPIPDAPPSSDRRITITVTEEERVHIQSQMLTYLVDLQTLNMAVADEDRSLIREVAEAQANRRGQTGIGRSLRAKMPDGFRQINQSLRSDFSALAEVSDTAPISELQERLSFVMAQCVACHGTYTVSVAQAD
ncbi:MAG: hypothetical protein ACK4NV_11180 [Pannonibacter sp.]